MVDSIAKKFRLTNQKIMLTYRSWIDKEAFIDWFQQNTVKCKLIRIAHESGHEETPYEHSHVLIDFGKAVNYTNCRKFDYNEIHPHIHKITTATHWKNSLVYMCKEDISNKDLIEIVEVINPIEKIWENNTVQEALINCNHGDIKNAPSIIQIFNLKNKDKSEFMMDESLMYNWQKHIIKICNSHPNDRDVYWVYDKNGGCGKSQLARHMVASGNDTYKVANCGGIKDFATIIINALSSGWNGRNIIIDLPRKAEHYDISACIEDVKNGCVTSTKYQGKTEFFKIPHVFVFANFLPKIGELSKDRWKIMTIVKSSTSDDHNEIVVNYDFAYLNIKDMLVDSDGRLTMIKKSCNDKINILVKQYKKDIERTLHVLKETGLSWEELLLVDSM